MGSCSARPFPAPRSRFSSSRRLASASLSRGSVAVSLIVSVKWFESIDQNRSTCSCPRPRGPPPPPPRPGRPPPPPPPPPARRPPPRGRGRAPPPRVGGGGGGGGRAGARPPSRRGAAGRRE